MPKSDQGIDQKRYQVIPRTLIFLFDAQNRVLLLQGSPSKRLWGGLYNGIGGHIEPGEDIREAAYRELNEEAGIEGVQLFLSAQIMVDVSDTTGVAIFVFRGEYHEEGLTASSEGALLWVDLDRLHEIPLVEDLSTLIPKVAAQRPSSAIIVGKYAYGQNGELEISLR